MEHAIFLEPQLGLSWDRLVATAEATERLGFDALTRSDHYVGPDRKLRGDPVVSDAWTTLAGLARDTTRVKLGTLVSPITFRHPGVLAVQVAGVDAMSGGRAELGLGAGWNAPEHEAYGIPFPAKRFGMFEESLQIITGLWATAPGDTFSFEGRHYRLDRAPGAQRPTGARIPITIGGGGAERTPALAARFADEFNAGFVPDQVVADRFDRVRGALDAQGRDPGSMRFSVALTTTVGATTAEADARARAQGSDPDEQRRAGLHGTPDDIAERVAGLAAIGCDRVYFQIIDPSDLDQLELLATIIGGRA